MTTGVCGCGSRWGGEQVCHCQSCHMTFVNLDGFDVHRREGRCLMVGQIMEMGYEPNRHGRWRKVAYT
jgi:hypothetical protein